MNDSKSRTLPRGSVRQRPGTARAARWFAARWLAARWLAPALAGVSALACSAGDGGPVTPPPQWTLVWSDEFDGAAGDPADLATWSFDVGGDGWGNAQLEFNTERPENSGLDGEGNLTITARREDYLGRRFTSARLKTLGGFSTTYGRIEARIALPRGRGIWPAFWMLGTDFPEVGWPECGEIDIMEFRGQEPRVVLGTIHGPGYAGGESISRSLRVPTEQRFDGRFAVFAVEWDPTRIAWSIDDEVYHVVTADDVTARGRWVFDHPFFLILNVAVGGTFVGDPDASTTFPQTMRVDYVRVYERVK